jgi:signal peptide peptidase SppA
MPHAIVTTDKGLWAGDYLSYLEYSALQAKVDIAAPAEFQEARSYMTNDQEEEAYQGYGYMVETFGSVAAVNIRGKLIAESNWLTRMFGMTGYDEVKNAVSAAAMEPGIDNIILDINSPGGDVNGLSEAATVIRAIDDDVTPVTAFTSGSMHSAAMWLGSAARKRHATEMASVGSVGVIAVHEEIVEKLKMEGRKVTVFTAGKYKGIGNPYEKLSTEDKAYFQSKVEAARGFFISALAENLGLSAEYVRDTIATGQDFFARDAIAVGLVDSINSFQEVVKLLDTVHNSQQM